jgi:glycosyltransferase involved in cell wall biosynthesis
MNTFVSVITPTYNRPTFIPQLLRIYKSQTYAKDKLEFIVADDGDISVADLFKDINWIKYHRFDKKITLGEKRNFLNKKAKGDIIICMDDDDYYSPDYIKNAVKELNRAKCLVAGSSMTYQYNMLEGVIYETPQFNDNHSCNGMLCYRKEYLKTHKYEDNKNWAEEKYFMNNYSDKLVQFKKFGLNLVINHETNTYDRTSSVAPYFKKTKYKLKDFIKEKDSLTFYKGLEPLKLKKEIMPYDSKINSYFDKVYIITLEKDRKRWQEMYFNLRKFGIYNYDKIMGENINPSSIPKTEYNNLRENHLSGNMNYIKGFFSCKRAHYKIIEEAYKKNMESVLIFEDDISFTDNIEEIFGKVIGQIDKSEWDMLYFGARHESPTILVDDNLMRITGSLGAFAYAINKTLIKVLYQSLFKNGCEVDTFYKAAIHTRFRCYSVYPHIVRVDGNNSNIYGTYIDYSSKVDNIPII